MSFAFRLGRRSQSRHARGRAPPAGGRALDRAEVQVEAQVEALLLGVEDQVEGLVEEVEEVEPCCGACPA